MSLGDSLSCIRQPEKENQRLEINRYNEAVLRKLTSPDEFTSLEDIYIALNNLEQGDIKG